MIDNLNWFYIGFTVSLLIGMNWLLLKQRKRIKCYREIIDQRDQERKALKAQLERRERLIPEEQLKTIRREEIKEEAAKQWLSPAFRMIGPYPRRPLDPCIFY